MVMTVHSSRNRLRESETATRAEKSSMMRRPQQMKLKTCAGRSFLFYKPPIKFRADLTSGGSLSFHIFKNRIAHCQTKWFDILSFLQERIGTTAKAE
jgi:hypothetical protein